jgi:hypothetical protein
MARARRLLVLVSLVSLTGCGTWNLGPWGGPAYEMDLSKMGTGESVFSLRNDAYYLDGMPTTKDVR